MTPSSPEPHHDASLLPRWRWGLSLASAAAAFVAVRALQVLVLGWGKGYDINAYARYARDWASGGIPYVTFHPEYPPGALLVFMLPKLVGPERDYGRAFHFVMLAFDLCCLLLIVVAAKQSLAATPSPPRASSRWLRWLRSRPLAWGVAYLLATAALFPVLYTRFDLAPAALTLAALVLLSRRRGLLPSSLLLGAAAAVKLWPLVLVPLWLVKAYRRRRAGGLLLVGAALAVGVAVTAAPAAWHAGPAVLSFAKYHAARSIQAESGWASVALIADAAGLADATVKHEYGAFHVKGALAAVLTRLSTPTLVLLVLLPQLLYTWRWRRRRPRGPAGVITATAPLPDPDAGLSTDAEAAAVALAAVLGFIIGGKVLSPQYLIWVAPLLPLALCRLGLPALLSSAALVLTSVVYPYLTPALEGRAPGHLVGVAAAAGRNLLLLVLYVLLLRAGGRGARQAQACDETAPLANAR